MADFGIVLIKRSPESCSPQDDRVGCREVRSAPVHELYASRDEESGRYRVSKILYADGSVVVARLYANCFDELPAQVPNGFGRTSLEELECGEIGIGWGAVAFDPAGLATEENILIGDAPVTDEELENVEDVLDPGRLEHREGVMSRLTGLLRRRS